MSAGGAGGGGGLRTPTFPFGPHTPTCVSARSPPLGRRLPHTHTHTHRYQREISELKGTSVRLLQQKQAAEGALEKLEQRSKETHEAMNTARADSEARHEKQLAELEATCRSVWEKKHLAAEAEAKQVSGWLPGETVPPDHVTFRPSPRPDACGRPRSHE